MPFETAFGCARGRWSGLLWVALAGMFLTACDNDEEVRKLAESIEIAERNVVALTLASTQDKRIFEPGESWQLVASGLTAGGTSVNVSADVRWSTSASAIATVDAGGLLRIGAVTGSQDFQVSAEWGRFRSTLDMTASDAELVSLAVSSTPDTPDECRTAALLATGTFSDASTRPLTDAVWSVDDEAVATISGNTLIAREAGVVTLTAVRGAISSPPLTLTVVDALNALRLNPADELSVRVNTTATIRAEGEFDGAATPEDISVATTWSSETASVATVSAAGIISGLRVGETLVTGTCGGLEATTLVSVLDATGIRIKDPSPDRLRTGEVRRLQLYEVLSDGSETTTDLAAEDTVIWKVEEGAAIATIDEEGVVTMAESFANYANNYIQITADYQQFDDEIEIFIEK